MSTYEEAFKTFTDEMTEMGFFYHEECCHAITKYLGPSIHAKDASQVAYRDGPIQLTQTPRDFLLPVDFSF